MGVLSIRDVYLAGGQQQTITVSNMRVPQRPEGSRVRYTLTVSNSCILTNKFQLLTILYQNGGKSLVGSSKYKAFNLYKVNDLDKLKKRNPADLF